MSEYPALKHICPFCHHVELVSPEQLGTTIACPSCHQNCLVTGPQAIPSDEISPAVPSLLRDIGRLDYVGIVLGVGGWAAGMLIALIGPNVATLTLAALSGPVVKTFGVGARKTAPTYEDFVLWLGWILLVRGLAFFVAGAAAAAGGIRSERRSGICVSLGTLGWMAFTICREPQRWQHPFLTITVFDLVAAALLPTMAACWISRMRTKNRLRGSGASA